MITHLLANYSASDIVVLLAFWGFLLIVGPLVGSLIGKRKGRAKVGALLGLFSFIGWLVILVLPKRGNEDAKPTKAESKGPKGWTEVQNTNYGAHQPQQLYYTWGTQHDGIALDLPGRKIYLSKNGRSKWFDIGQIKRWATNEGPMTVEFYVITNDIQYPEFLWKFGSRHFLIYDYPAFARAMHAVGNFSDG